MEIVIASKNLHKVREFREILKKLEGLDLVTLNSFPDYHPPSETGKTFQENAELKAVHAAKELGRLVMADDSGLVVPVLGGEPGIHSRRYAGEDATDLDNRKKLLEALRGKEDVSRGAYFECVIALAGPEGLLKTVTGRCEGWIASEEKGSNGFGYDPLFIKHDYDKTFAQLTDSVKNRISHRAKAVAAILPFLENQLAAPSQ